MTADSNDKSEHEGATDMLADSQGQTPLAEERLMALLALTSGELADRPNGAALDAASSGELTDEERRALHDHLDAHPEAFAAFLARHARPPEAVRSARLPLPHAQRGHDWRAALRRTSVRYALAASVAVLCIALGMTSVLTRRNALSASLERSFADVAQIAASEPRSERSVGRAILGFSPSQASVARRSFAAGVAAAALRLETGGAADLAQRRDRYFALGEWNGVLSAAAQLPPRLDAGFWRRQLETHERFGVALAAAADPIVAGHLERLASLLRAMAEQHAPARSAAALQAELGLFRAAYGAPDDGATKP